MASHVRLVGTLGYHRGTALITTNHGHVLMSVVVLALVVVLSEPATAQDGVGAVYCDTRVEQGIDVVFGAIAGLGLPATMLYVIRGGLNYMRAGGRPQQREEAREQLLMAGTGFAIIILALAAPGIVTKLGGELGFGFSDCVHPV